MASLSTTYGTYPMFGGGIPAGMAGCWHEQAPVSAGAEACFFSWWVSFFLKRARLLENQT